MPGAKLRSTCQKYNNVLSVVCCRVASALFLSSVDSPPSQMPESM